LVREEEDGAPVTIKLNERSLFTLLLLACVAVMFFMTLGLGRMARLVPSGRSDLGLVVLHSCWMSCRDCPRRRPREERRWRQALSRELARSNRKGRRWAPCARELIISGSLQVRAGCPGRACRGAARLFSIRGARARDG
jgi:hypothetical protein